MLTSFLIDAISLDLTALILDCAVAFVAGIKDLPDSIKECKSLRSIDISVNPFDRFPDAITHIVGLRELYINDAYIEYLPANFGRLSALRTLELRENNMMTLPKSMSRLVNLQRLDIGNNDFTELVRAPIFVTKSPSFLNLLIFRTHTICVTFQNYWTS